MSSFSFKNTKRAFVEFFFYRPFGLALVSFPPLHKFRMRYCFHSRWRGPRLSSPLSHSKFSPFHPWSRGGSCSIFFSSDLFCTTVLKTSTWLLMVVVIPRLPFKVPFLTVTPTRYVDAVPRKRAAPSPVFCFHSAALRSLNPRVRKVKQALWPPPLPIL